MAHKPAKVHDTPVPESTIQRSDERDTLNDTPELRFLRDEIEALLGSATVQRAMHAPHINYADDHEAIAPEDLGKEWLERATESEPSAHASELSPEGTIDVDAIDVEVLEESPDSARDTAEFDNSIYERDTEPSVDVQLLREAVRVAGK